MRKLTASAAICAILAAGPALAQDSPDTTDQSVLRNDLPETHAGFDLPQVDAATVEIGEAELQSLVAHSTGAQQMGNIIASKHASGVARDLGDAMILLHAAILRRIAPDGQESRVPVPEEAQSAMAELDALNGQEANLAFASWIADTYPRVIQGWQEAGEQGGLGELSQAVVPLLEQQHAVAEEIVAAEGDLDMLDNAAVEQLRLGGAEDVGMSQGDGPTGAEGQLGERQHTPEPEPPAVQTGETYAQEQVQVDPQSETQAAPEAGGEASAAGELDIVNAGGLFSAMSNPSVEIEQLQGRDVAADQIRVVAVSELLTEAELESFASTLSEVEGELSSLRDAAAGHSGISGALEQTGAARDEVVAIDVLDEGVVIYTHAD